MRDITIYDATTGETVEISGKGQDPHAVIIPYDFKYPLEKHSIVEAYELFKNWTQNRNSDNNWYTLPVESKVVGK